MGLYENTENGLKLLAGSTLYADAPIGAIQAFGGATAPSGWFICDGSAKSRTDFAELFAVIGTAFGTGDGSTTFNLPDLREAVPKGAGETGKTVGAHVKSGGLALGEFLDDRVQTHTHSYQHDFGLYAGSGNSRIGDDKIHNDNTGNNTGRSGATTEVKSVGVNYIIKAKQTALPVDLASEVAKLNSPDWSNAVALDYATYGSQFLAGNYEVPDDGWLVGYWLGNTSSDTLKINNVVVGASSYANSNWCGYGHVNMKVNKGDKVELSSVFSSAFFVFSFVPHK